MQKRFFFLLLLVLFQQSLLAQDFFYRVNQLNMDDGLSFRHATCVVQDNQGLMWIGTRNGLNRFDGYEFLHYTSKKGEYSPQLSGNLINDLEVDLDGNLWIATNLGLDILDPTTNKIKSYTTSEIFKNKPGIKGIDEISITSVNGRVFIHSHQFQRFDRFYNTAEYRDGRFYELIISDSTHQQYPYIANVFEDSDSNLWCRPANTKTFYQLNHQFQVLKTIELPDSIGPYRLISALTEKKGEDYGPYLPNIEFLRLSGKGLPLMGTFCDSKNTFMIQGDLKKGFRLVNDSIGLTGKHMPVNYFVDREEDIWMQKGQELGIVKHNQFYPIDTLLFNFRNDNITFFNQSKDGTVWITSGFGVYRVTKERNPFQFHLSSALNEKGFGKSLRAIEKGPQNTLFASVTHDGIWEVDLANKTEKQLIGKRFNNGQKNYSILPYAMHYQDSVLWLCNWFDEGILKLNLNPIQLEHIHCSENMDGYARTMVAEQNKRLWVGTDRGLNVYDLERQEFLKFAPTSGSDLIENQDISSLHFSDSTGLWVGTREQGVFLIEPDGKLVSIVNKEAGLSSNSILSLLEQDSLLWIGTPSGLNRYDKNKRSITVYDSRNGLPDQQINAILEREGVLWLSTNKGLCRFNATTEVGNSYFLEDGLIHEEFNYSSNLKLDDTTLLFGGMNGLVKVNQEIKEKEKTEPEIILTQFSRSGEQQSTPDQTLFAIRKNGVDIEPSDKSFRFGFTYLDLFSANHIQYKYRLEGYDENWTLNGSKNSVRFNKLPAGEYTFRVKALNQYGVWSEKTLAIPVRIHQVFYKKTGFIFLCILIVLNIFFLIYFIRVKQIKNMVELRLQIASNLHDDVGSLLSQISIQSELLKAKVYSKEEEKIELEKMVDNSKAASSSMSDVVWSIDSRQDQLSDLLDRMKDYAMDVLSKKNIRFQFLQNKDLDEGQVLSPQFRQSVYLIFKEAINNITKHSNADKVEVNIEYQKNSFKMSVSDNGNTDKSENRLPGQGLKNMQMRTEKLRGELYISQNKGFKIVLKVNT